MKMCSVPHHLSPEALRFVLFVTSPWVLTLCSLTCFQSDSVNEFGVFFGGVSFFLGWVLGHTPRHVEVPGPGIEPVPQQWQHCILNPWATSELQSVTYFYLLLLLVSLDLMLHIFQLSDLLLTLWLPHFSLSSGNASPQPRVLSLGWFPWAW